MDLSTIKSQLETFNNKRGASNVDWEAKKAEQKALRDRIVWSPTVGKYTIRILPSSVNKENPFKTVEVYYKVAKYTVLSLNQFGESDPIYDYKQGLLKQYNTRKNDAQYMALLKSLNPSKRISCHVLVRGEEEKGPRIWQFGTTLHKQILETAGSDETYQTFEDANHGIDWTLTVKEMPANKQDFGKYEFTITPKPKQCPISTDKAVVARYLNEQPDVLSLYEKKSTEDLQRILDTFLQTTTTGSNPEGTFKSYIKEGASKVVSPFKGSYEKVSSAVVNVENDADIF